MGADPDDESGTIYPGAIVEVYVNGVYRGSIESGTTTVSVPIIGGVREGDRVIEVLQRLCDRESERSETLVRACRGRFRVGLKCMVEGDRIDDVDFVRTAENKLLTQFNFMRDLYRFHGFEVDLLGEPEVLPLPPELEMITDTDHAQISLLLSMGERLSDTDIAIYQVPVILGSAGFHREGEHAVVVQRQLTGESILPAAHEVGHALGLRHPEGATETGTLMLSAPPNIDLDSEVEVQAALLEWERMRMEESRFKYSC